MKQLRQFFANRRFNRMIRDLMQGNPSMTREYAVRLIANVE